MQTKWSFCIGTSLILIGSTVSQISMIFILKTMSDYYAKLSTTDKSQGRCVGGRGGSAPQAKSFAGPEKI